MNIEIKDGVSIKNLTPKLFEAIFESAKVFNSKNYLLEITSTDEVIPQRLENSFHYEGKAIDLWVLFFVVIFHIIP